MRTLSESERARLCTAGAMEGYQMEGGPYRPLTYASRADAVRGAARVASLYGWRRAEPVPIMHHGYRRWALVNALALVPPAPGQLGLFGRIEQSVPAPATKALFPQKTLDYASG